MSAGDEPIDTADGERHVLAGEYALGLLSGAELLEARGRMASDAAFAHDVAVWEARLAPLFDTVTSVAPPAHVWQAIAAELATLPEGRRLDNEVVRLKRQVRGWQLGTGIAAALAGVLAITGLQPHRAPVPAAPPQPVAPAVALAGALAPKGGGSISVVYRPGEQRLAALADGLKPRAGHDLELWLLPAGDAPLPLGLVAPGQSRRLPLAAATTAKLGPGSTIAVSLEPVGGSPTGLPTGPVLAVAKILPA